MSNAPAGLPNLGTSNLCAINSALQALSASDAFVAQLLCTSNALTAACTQSARARSAISKQGAPHPRQRKSGAAEQGHEGRLGLWALEGQLVGSLASLVASVYRSIAGTGTQPAPASVYSTPSAPLHCTLAPLMDMLGTHSTTAKEHARQHAGRCVRQLVGELQQQGALAALEIGEEHDAMEIVESLCQGVASEARAAVVYTTSGLTQLLYNSDNNNILSGNDTNGSTLRDNDPRHHGTKGSVLCNGSTTCNSDSNGSTLCSNGKIDKGEPNDEHCGQHSAHSNPSQTHSLPVLMCQPGQPSEQSAPACTPPTPIQPVVLSPPSSHAPSSASTQAASQLSTPNSSTQQPQHPPTHTPPSPSPQPHASATPQGHDSGLHFLHQQPSPAQPSPTQSLNWLHPTQGLLATSTVCTACDTCSGINHTPFHVLHLPLPSVRGVGGLARVRPGCTLQTCMRAFSCAQHVEGVSCQRCTLQATAAAAAAAAVATVGRELGTPVAATPAPSPVPLPLQPLPGRQQQQQQAPTTMSQRMHHAGKDPRSVLSHQACALAAAPASLPLPDLEEEQFNTLLESLLLAEGDFDQKEAQRANTRQDVSYHHQQQQQQQQRKQPRPKSVRCPAYQHTSIAALPSVLFLHLQRSQWDASCVTGPAKVHGRVPFPLLLGPADLELLCPLVLPQSVLHGASPGQSAEAGSASDLWPHASKVGCTRHFRLQAVLVHLGHASGGGSHWIAYRRGYGDTPAAEASQCSSTPSTPPPPSACKSPEISGVTHKSGGVPPNVSHFGKLPGQGVGGSVEQAHWFRTSDESVVACGLNEVLASDATALVYEAYDMCSCV